MPDQTLRRTAENLWNIWLDLNYAAADLACLGADQTLRSEIGLQAEELRSLAERLEQLAARNAMNAGDPTQRMRRPPSS